MIEFNLNSYSTQKVLYEEPTDEELESVDPLYFGKRYLDSSTKQILRCDNLENIISKLIWYYSIISALLTEPKGIELWEALILIPDPLVLFACMYWLVDLGSGSQIPVRQKVRNACHGGTIWPWSSVRLWGCTTLKIGKPSRVIQESRISDKPS